ncbi:MAG: tetratricopeptide repeat protein, partial [Candidatus Woesearchaeota archaeon]
SKNLLKSTIIKHYIPYFIIGLFYIAIRFFVIGVRGRIEEYLAGNFFLTMLTMLKVYVYYIYLLIFPINLTLFHDIIPATSIFNPKVLISALILTAIIFFTLKYNKNKILFFSVFWFFIALIPFSNLLPLQVFMAERYLYVPSIAFSLLASYFLFTIFNYDFKNINKNIVRYGVMIFIVLLICFYVFSTVNRNKDWRDDLTLWSKTVDTNPNNSMAHDNLGFTYERSGDDATALEEFNLAVKLQPDNFRALANLGVVLAKLGAYNESIAVLKKSIEARPYHKTYDKLGLVYAKLNMEEKAIESFKEAIKINPRYAKAHNDLAAVYGRIGEFDLAMQEFDEAIRIDRDYADAYYNSALIYEFLKDNKKAENLLVKALEIEPDNKNARDKLDFLKSINTI